MLSRVASADFSGTSAMAVTRVLWTSCSDASILSGHAANVAFRRSSVCCIFPASSSCCRLATLTLKASSVSDTSEIALSNGRATSSATLLPTSRGKLLTATLRGSRFCRIKRLVSVGVLAIADCNDSI